jgi:hypothetical protein
MFFKIYQRMNPQPDWWFIAVDQLPIPSNMPWEVVDGQMTDSRDVFRGSGMLSRAVGDPFGVSLKSDVTIVKLPKPIRGPGDKGLLPLYRYFHMLDAFRQILADVNTRGLNKRAVVSFSISWDNEVGGPINDPPVPGVDKIFGLLYQAIQALISNGVVFVTSTGNYGDPDYEVSLRLLGLCS